MSGKESGLFFSKKKYCTQHLFLETVFSKFLPNAEQNVLFILKNGGSSPVDDCPNPPVRVARFL